MILHQGKSILSCININLSRQIYFLIINSSTIRDIQYNQPQLALLLRGSKLVNKIKTMINRIVVYGGNGFVGSVIVEKIAKNGFFCTNISRTGKKNPRLNGRNEEWMKKVEWIRGDANDPDLSILAKANAVIISIGSPPLPTFSKQVFDKQIFKNGETNESVIEAAKKVNVNRVVLISAHVPNILKRKGFGYYAGKHKAFIAAKKFVGSSPHRTAVVLKPSGIYGTRYTKSGIPIPLWLFMKPISYIQRMLPSFITKHLPAKLVSVEEVASAAAKAAIEINNSKKQLLIIENEHIIKTYFP